MRLDALRSLRNTVASYLRAASSAAIESLADGLLRASDASSSGQNREKGPEPLPAEQLYAEYLPRFVSPINTAGLGDQEREFLRVFYNAEAQQMIEEIMSLGRPLAALSTGSHEVEHYLVLLPLLHSPSRFDAGLLEVLPAWVLAAGRRSELADFCLLGLGRLDAAVAIVTHPVDKKGLRNSAYEYFLSAVEKCQKNNRPDLAVECLRSAIALLAKDDPEVLALRLKIYRIWSDRGNYDLAAGEAKQILDDFPSGDHVGEVAYFRMLCLARQGDSKAIRMEIDDLLADSRCSLYAQRLLYLKWYALQKEGNSEAAWLVVQQYVSKYPQSPYAADMRFAAAVQFFHEGRHAEAVRQLEEFATDYPDGKHTKAAKALLKQLRKVVRENATNASFGKAPED